jgi:hypothetical protein
MSLYKPMLCDQSLINHKFQSTEDYLGIRPFKSWFISTVFLIPLFWEIINAVNDLLKLYCYQEGEIPFYGENIVVKQDEKTGIKWISPGADSIGSGTIKFPMNLSGL